MASTSTGHIVNDISIVPPDKRSEYTPVPAELQPKADEALAGKLETTIDVKGDSELAAWMRKENAAKKRSARKAKRRRNVTAKKSRRRNRKR